MVKKRGRPSAWNSPTELVRLPSHAIPQCLKLARQLDQPRQVFVQKEGGPLLISVGDEKGYRGYLLDSPMLEPEQQALVDALAERLTDGMSAKDIAWMVTEIAPRILREVA